MKPSAPPAERRASSTNGSTPPPAGTSSNKRSTTWDSTKFTGSMEVTFSDGSKRRLRTFTRTPEQAAFFRQVVASSRS